MNLYLVLAIALGAMTGMTPAAPAVRPVQLVALRERRAQRRVIARRPSALGARRSAVLRRNLRTDSCALSLTRGNSAPRAPALA